MKISICSYLKLVSDIFSDFTYLDHFLIKLLRQLNKWVTLFGTHGIMHLNRCRPLPVALADVLFAKYRRDKIFYCRALGLSSTMQP